MKCVYGFLIVQFLLAIAASLYLANTIPPEVKYEVFIIRGGYYTNSSLLVVIPESASNAQISVTRNTFDFSRAAIVKEPDRNIIKLDSRNNTNVIVHQNALDE